MGTKGRDACLWLFFALIFSIPLHGLAKAVIAVVLLLLALSFLYHCAWYLPGAVRKSRELGLRMVVLLPVNPFWARMLLRLDRESLDSFRGAYEVHLKSGKQDLGDFLQALASDLGIAAKTFPGALFLWETSAPLPLAIRRMIRQGSSRTAFLKQGGWPVRRFPGTGRDMRKGRVRHGAIIA
jgi:hypothetical protein